MLKDSGEKIVLGKMQLKHFTRSELAQWSQYVLVEKNGVRYVAQLCTKYAAGWEVGKWPSPEQKIEFPFIVKAISLDDEIDTLIAIERRNTERHEEALAKTNARLHHNLPA